MNAHPLWLAEDVVRAVQGRCLHEQSWTATGVSIDSRTTVSGDLYVALQEPSHDGHDDVGAAFAAGAVAALVVRQPLQAPPDAPLVFVDDTFWALQELGNLARERAQGKMVVVTGSVGKTCVKEMLRLCLGAVGRVYVGPDVLAGRWGLSLALANLPSDADYGVFEIGVGKPGELSELSFLVRPDVAVITTIDDVHLELFSSQESLADAKADLFLGLTENGVAIVNRDTAHFNRISSFAKSQGIKNIQSFSENEKAEATLLGFCLTEDGSSVDALFEGRKIAYTIGAPGRHFVMNSLAALLAAFAASGKLDECAAAFPLYRPPEGCGRAMTVRLSDEESFVLIDESRNACPASVRAALCVLAQTAPLRDGRRLLVLGDMGDLGVASPDLHIGLVPFIIEAKVSLVFCCGPRMRYLFDALPEALRGAYAEDSAELAALMARAVRADDVITVKGSENMEMRRVVEALVALDPGRELKIANA